MGVIGVSIILAFVVLVIMYPQSWRQLAQPFFQWRGQGEAADSATTTAKTTAETETKTKTATAAIDNSDRAGQKPAENDRDRLAMPPPPIIRSEPPKTAADEDDDDDDEATTPKATPTVVAAAVPTFSLSEDSDDDTDSMPPPMFPSPYSAQRAGASADPSRAPMLPPPRPNMMAPPPRPSAGAPALSAAVTARRAPSLPVPNRGAPQQSARPPVLGGSLAPPPSTMAVPTRPAKTGRNKVMLTPGHSPLDWARLTADPVGNNLRGNGVPADAPYLLRITPSQLKQMNGRKGRDAWTALGGMVYNMTPYVPFHPGGAGELLRCAGKDGNKLFNEVHSWVNYENMLSACRVGILVDEGASTTSPMEEMD